MADGKLNPDTESWLVIIALGLPLINCFSLIFKGEWKQRRKKREPQPSNVEMIELVAVLRPKATLSFHLILNRFLEWNDCETVINYIASSHWQKVRTNTLIKHLNATRKYGSKLRTQTRNNLSFLVYLQKTLEPVIVLTQSQSLVCFPRGGFVCLERELCFTIECKDWVDSSGPLVWIHYIETVDALPFLKDTVNSFFTSL